MGISIRGRTLKIPRSIARVRGRSLPSAAPVALGANWMWVGDSEDFGYGDGTTKNPGLAFKAIWDLTQTPPSSQIINGVSGRPLSGTRTYYDEHADKGTRTAICICESGDQNEDGQRTASEFGDTFDAFVTEIRANTPDAVIIMRTPYSFGRTSQWRNWAAYVTELRARVAAWAALGVIIYLAEVDRNMTALELLIPGEVFFSAEESNSYHYKNPGNLLNALSVFDALHYPMAGLDLSAITNVTTDQKNACLQVIAEYQ